MPGPTRLYTPEDIADALGVSAWWVKEQARKGRAAATKAAGAWRFTDAQYRQLLALLEQPAVPDAVQTTPARRSAQRAEAGTPPQLHLVARTPRRKQRVS